MIQKPRAKFSNSQPHINTIKYPPASFAITKFLEAVPPCTSDTKNILLQMSSYLQKAKNIERVISEKIQNINLILQNAIDTFSLSFVRHHYTHEVIFIINKYLNIFIKYQHIRFFHFNQVRHILQEFEQMISTSLEHNAPISIQFWDFIAFAFGKSDPFLLRLEFKLKSLYNYLNNCPEINRIPAISHLRMIDQLKDLRNHVDSSNDYIPPNDFDTTFENYVLSNRTILNSFDQLIGLKAKTLKYDNNINSNINPHSSKSSLFNNFDIIIDLLHRKTNQISDEQRQISSMIDSYHKQNNQHKIHEITPDSIDLKTFSELVNFLYREITSLQTIDKKMLTIFKCSAFRFLCNRYYILHNKEWLQKPNSNYFYNCQKMILSTPNELKISTEIIPCDFCNMKFHNLLLYNQQFVTAVSRMLSIQFLTCPLDIWNETYKSIESAIQAANRLSQIDDDKSKISFDDFFTILLPVFASAQIMCPDALASIIRTFINIKKSNSFDIAATTTLALLRMFESNI